MKSLFLSLKTSTLSLLVALSIGASLTTIQSCMAPYDAIGMENATSVSTKLPAVMEKATESYSKNEADVKAVTNDLDKAATHAASMKKNKEVAESWRILQNDLVAPFFARWKEKGKLDKNFIKEATAQVNKSLAAIKKSETAKKK